MAKKITLPDWAELVEDNKIAADPDKFYPALLGEVTAYAKALPETASGPIVDKVRELVGTEIKPGEIGDMWLECGYQWVKLRLQKALGRVDFQIKILNRPEWKISNLRSSDVTMAAQGKMARNIYLEVWGPQRGLRG